MPDVTLITICWNAAATISRTLDSVLAQKRLPWEYRFIDGGSTDGTLELLEKYRPRFEERGVRFFVEAQRRKPGEAGIPNAWNQAIVQAAGDVVGLLNADDWYDPEVLSAVCDAFQADSGVGAVSMPVQMHHEDPRKEWLFTPQSPKALPWKMTVPHPGTFFRKSVYDQVGLYDTRYRISADYDFVWRCSKAGVRWLCLERPRVHMQLGGLANASRSQARRETYRIARENGSFWDCRPALAWLLRTLLNR